MLRCKKKKKKELLSAPFTLDKNKAYHMKKTLCLVPYPVESIKKKKGRGQKQRAPDKHGHIDKMEIRFFMEKTTIN